MAPVIQKWVETLVVPDPWDRQRFVAGVGGLRGREIVLVPFDRDGAMRVPTAAWIVGDEVDYIVHMTNTSESHIDHIVMHEVGHMLLDHDQHAHEISASAMFARLLPDLDPSKWLAVLERSSYEEADEMAAEMFASLMMVRKEEASAGPPTALRMLAGDH